MALQKKLSPEKNIDEKVTSQWLIILKGFQNLFLLKYMLFKDNPPHRFSQFLLFDFINKIENFHFIHI